MSGHEANPGTRRAAAAARLAPPAPAQEIPILPPALISAPPGVGGMPLADAGPMPQPKRVQPPKGLGPAFRGEAAGVGARVIAFTIDIAATVLLAVLVLLLTRSPVLAALAAAELTVGMWVLEARTGITLGNAALRLRSSRADAPFSPGIGRQLVRGVVAGAGFAVAVGSWLVMASGAWDPSGRRRTWADRIAGTVVVAVPARATADAPAVAAPGEQPTLLPPTLIDTSRRASATDDDTHTDSHAAARHAVIAQPLALSHPAPPPAPVTSTQQIVSHGGAAAVEHGAVLLIFDTGQRVQLSMPMAANLGRAPAPSIHGDELVVVDDPDLSVSKTHLRVEHQRSRTWITDFGSTNGSAVRSDDGHLTELPAGERVLLDDADRVRMGNRSFTVSVLMGNDRSSGERA
ncbi:MAG: FHA domain-containing protein [Microbacterium sp.]|uniref:FHA domain-containing protein n=1 Tax=Microbacterium sp. TaxID=51671 RepID=UPI003F9B3979